MQILEPGDGRAFQAFPDPAMPNPARRRILVFFVVLAIVAAAGLSFTFLRPAEYRATARLEIVPASGLAPTSEEAARPSGPIPNNPFLTEVEFLTSRPVLERLSAEVDRAGLSASLRGADPIAALQQMISISPVAGTNVAQLTATGEHPEILAFALNRLMEIYRAHVAERYSATSGEALAQAGDEVGRYEKAVADKRRAMDAFRAQHNIVSLEREENQTLARVKGLSTALNTAEEKAVEAETRLRSLKASIAEGRSAVRSRDNPTLAGIESRLSQAREEIRQLERSYTENYLARDPQVKALRTRITTLEEQVKREREASQAANLADAEEEAARTRDAVEKIKGQLSANKQTIQNFSARFNEYKALQEEVTHLETLYRTASEKQVRLQASEQSRRPEARVIEPAGTPAEPFRPLYARDAGISAAAALALAFLAAWLTDFLTRRERGPQVVVAPAAVAYPVPMGAPSLAGMPRPHSLPFGPAAALPNHIPAETVTRELTDDEVTALLGAADDAARPVLAALLCGVSPEEMLEVRWRDLDEARQVLRIAQPSSREIALEPELAELLLRARDTLCPAPEDCVFSRAGKSSADATDLETLVAYAAHDAALEQPAGVTPTALRHTYLAFLARQGVRFSDMDKVVGPLPAGLVATYGGMAPAGQRRAISEAQRVLPAIRKTAGLGGPRIATA